MKTDPALRSDIRWSITLSLVALGSFAILAAVPFRTTVSFEFYYPANEISQIDRFKVYSVTNATATNWTVYASINPATLTMTGTNSLGMVTNRFSLPIDAQ